MSRLHPRKNNFNSHKYLFYPRNRDFTHPRNSAFTRRLRIHLILDTSSTMYSLGIRLFQLHYWGMGDWSLYAPVINFLRWQVAVKIELYKMRKTP